MENSEEISVKELVTLEMKSHLESQTIENDGEKYLVEVEIQSNGKDTGTVALFIKKNAKLVSSNSWSDHLWFPRGYKVTRFSFEQYSPFFGRTLFEAIGIDANGKWKSHKLLLDEMGKEDLRFNRPLAISPSGEMIMTDSSVVSFDGNTWSVSNNKADFGYFLTDSLFVYGSFENDQKMYSTRIMDLSGKEYHQFLLEFPNEWPQKPGQLFTENREEGYIAWQNLEWAQLIVWDLKHPEILHTFPFDALEMYDHRQGGRPGLEFSSTGAVFYMGADRMPQACWKPSRSKELDLF